MIALGIDTSLSHCSVAISVNGELCVDKSINCKNGQAEILPNLVSELLQQVQILPKQIERIVVTTGPGSFSGVRVGLAFAKGFALPIDCPIIGVSSLKLLSSQSESTKNIAIIEQMGSIFAAAYENDRELIAPMRAESFDFLDAFSTDWVVSGFNEREEFAKFTFTEQKFLDVKKLIQIGGGLLPIENPPVPQYLRGADAKLWVGSQYV